MAVGQVLTNDGEEWAAGALAQTDALSGQFVQWGVGLTTPVKANTAIESTTGATESRATGTVTKQGTGATAVYQNVATITKTGGAAAITECGTFSTAGAGNPPTGGLMYTHFVFNAVNLAINDSITFTITIDPA